MMTFMREKFARDSLKFLPVIIVAAMVLLTTIAYGFVFSSNDDGMLRAIASGSYTGKPDAHLIYILYPMGLVFKLLYTLIPSVPWYDLLLTILHLSCFYLLIKRAMEQFEGKRKVMALIVTTLFLFAVDFKYLVLHQYTILAGFIMATALFYLVTIKAGCKKDLVTIVILLTFCLWLRKEVFFMGLPLLLLVLFALVVVKKKQSAFIVCGLAVTAFIAFLSLLADSFAYSSDEWKAYKEFNQARTQVYDYFKFPEYASYRETYEALDIDESQYEVLAHYLDVSLPSDLTEDKLTALSQKYDQIMEEWKQFYSVPKKIIKDTGLEIIHNEVQPLGIIMFASCILVFLLYLKKNIWVALVALASYAYRLVFTAYFVSKGRFPERVSYGLYIMISLIMAGLIVNVIKDISDRNKLIKVFTALTAVLLLAATVFGLVKTQSLKQRTSENASELSCIYSYCSEHPENIYFVNTYSIAPLTEEMFSFEKIPQNCIIMGNWTSHSPLEKARLERTKVESFQNDLVQNEMVYLIVKSELGSDWIENFYRSYKDNVLSEECDRIKALDNQEFIIVDIKKASD